MAASGRPIEISFTPSVAGKVKVLVSLNAAAGSGSDWGSNRQIGTFCEQDGTTTYGPLSVISNARAPYTMIGSFDVTAGSLVKVGLWAGVSGAAAMTVYAGANALAEFNPA